EDGDCVGSELALCSILRRLGKEAIPCSSGPFKRTEIKPYEKFFRTGIDIKTLVGARLIITDCGGLDRTGDLAPFLKGLPAAIIDHHKSNAALQKSEGNPIYICEDSPSVTLMILNLIDALDLELLGEEAEYLLFGLCTDTGFFRHTDTGNAETFEAAARLTRAGASPKKVYELIYGGKSLGSRILLGHILGRTEAYFNGKLLLSTEEYEETQTFGAEGRDSDVMYQLLQSVKGAEAVVVISQKNPDRCNIGLRSRSDIDVAAIAKRLGGGGHKNAAGAVNDGSIEETKIKILELFGETGSFSKLG
ncbi:MAG: bifunctional oligoribonuclease/PAP phosphatase NrnA, partial [Treponema sp.]|nr:bifunctional oligoribonuclease/PAP phosphatase NrnA [Treponema sp.]